MGRKLLTTFSVITIYAVISGVILAFAQGYTVDLQSQQVLRTGVLEISTFPSDSQVMIDNISVQSTTPVSLSHYLPQNYTVQLSLPGYKSMQIKAPVKAQLVTRLREIPLWPEKESWQTKEMSDPILSLQTLTESGLLMLRFPREIAWWQVNNKTLEKVIALPVTEIEYPLCTTDGTACLIVGDNRSVLVNLVNKDFTVFKQGISTTNTAQFFRFHADYYLLAEDEYGVTLKKLTAEGTLLDQFTMTDIHTFQLQGQELWYIEADRLYSRSLISGQKELITTIGDKSIDKLVINDNYIAWHSLDGQVSLFNRITKTIANTWRDGRLFASANQILVVSEAKVWNINAEGIQFIGQAPSNILVAQLYGNFTWLAQQADGKLAYIMLAPANIYSISESSLNNIVLPYEALIKWQDRNLYYHVFPKKTWLGLE
ncbi:MAG: PEGA domain-containing protein [Candidatus Abawacabacteria bacterium]|nr:PEGA domain-containing protein [Candidatus Abawacabacteria bacterium]